MPGSLRLSGDQLRAILDHVHAGAPEEVCGILAGDPDGTVHQVFLMENSEHSQTLYMMDSREQFRVFDQIERDRLSLVAIFHSHPHSEAYPSARDRELAFYPESLYMIISLAGEEPEWHAFRIIDGEVEEADVIVQG